MQHSRCKSAKQKGKGEESVVGGKEEQGGKLKAKVFWSKGKKEEAAQKVNTLIGQKIYQW